MGPTDIELVRRYAATGCEEAFAELVRRHLGLTYGVALRNLRSPHLAEEVTQLVWIELARRAKALGASTVLPAWLHEVARRKAIDVHRREARRVRRETMALEQRATSSDGPADDLRSVLDEGLGALSVRDRAALVLRHLEGKSLGDVAAALGVSEDAAQKRVARLRNRPLGEVNPRSSPRDG